ncbi:MAG: FAD-dependent oxidoreductase [Chloroflexota bacterium]|nr:FAD-dependent oxidoreductase [Chloroflexota bacterium]
MPMSGAPTESDVGLAVIVVGAGMAGLTCATVLHAAGRPVVVLEASDGVGGRVRTDRHPSGYLLDRGFQVILEAYPALRRHLDIASLRPAAFDAGALVWTGRRLVPLADPLRHPAALPRDLTTSLFGAGDKLRLATLALRARVAGWESAREASGDPSSARSAAEILWSAGFGRGFVDRFARPFWGGILLDRSLATDAGPLRFTLKMFLEGNAILPDSGVQAMPERLARRLPMGAVRLHRPVEALVTEGNRVTGVRVRGETLPATAVVVATDPPTAKHLTGIDAIPDRGVPCATVFLAGAREPGLGRRLTLDGTGTSLVNHLAPLSTVAPNYAPPGRHLLAAVVLSDALEEDGLDDDSVLAQRARDAAATMLGHDPADWTPLRVVRVSFSQFAQPPGIYGRLPGNVTGTRGLYLATEATVDSSYNGAILSGEAAARAVLADLTRRRGDERGRP